MVEKLKKFKHIFYIVSLIFLTIFWLILCIVHIPFHIYLKIYAQKLFLCIHEIQFIRLFSSCYNRIFHIMRFLFSKENFFRKVAFFSLKNHNMFVYKHNKKRGKKMTNLFKLEKNIYFEFGFYLLTTTGPSKYVK